MATGSLVSVSWNGMVFSEPRQNRRRGRILNFTKAASPGLTSTMAGRNPKAQRVGARRGGGMAWRRHHDVDRSRRLREEGQGLRGERHPGCGRTQRLEAEAINDGSGVAHPDGERGSSAWLHLDGFVGQLS